MDAQNQDVDTKALRKAAADEAETALLKFAEALKNDNKPYGASEVQRMATEVWRWGKCE